MRLPELSAMSWASMGERSCELPGPGHDLWCPCVPSEEYLLLVMELSLLVTDLSVCNPITRRLRQEDPKIEASLGYIVS